MSYEKQTWVTGDVVTADKLNHMEDGISNSGGGGTGGGDMFVVYVTATPIVDGNGYTFATETAYADVLAALEAGKVVIYWATFDNDEDEYVNLEMSWLVGYSKSGDTIFLELGNGMNLTHTADGIAEDGGDTPH